MCGYDPYFWGPDMPSWKRQVKAQEQSKNATLSYTIIHEIKVLFIPFVLTFLVQMDAYLKSLHLRLSLN